MIEVKAKKKDGDGDERRPPTADGGRQRALGQIDAADAVGRLIENAGGEDDRRGGAADDDGIDKYPEHLHVALRSRMRRIRGSGRRRVGRGTHAGFVGEQAALYALGHRLGDAVTDGAGRGFLQTEGAFEDQRQDRRHVFDVMANHPEGQQQVGAGHQRHHQFGHFGNGANAAEDYHAAQ